MVGVRYRRFETPLAQTTDYKIGIYCVSPKYSALSRDQRLVGSESG